jgi:hypothetical protein
LWEPRSIRTILKNAIMLCLNSGTFSSSCSAWFCGSHQCQSSHNTSPRLQSWKAQLIREVFRTSSRSIDSLSIMPVSSRFWIISGVGWGHACYSLFLRLKQYNSVCSISPLQTSNIETVTKKRRWFI